MMAFYTNATTTTASSIMEPRMLLEQTAPNYDGNNISSSRNNNISVPDLNTDLDRDPDPGSGPEPWVYLTEEMMFYFQAGIGPFNFFVNMAGVVTNILNIIVFWRVGFKESTVNLSLFALAISDCGACFSLLWGCVSLLPWFQPQRQPDLPYHPYEVAHIVSAWPRLIFTKVTILITAFITFERCLCVAMPLSVKTLFTPLRVKAVLVFCYASIIALTVPVLYVNRLAPKFYPEWNRTMVGIVFTEERVRVENVCRPIHIMIAIFSFFFIVLCTIVLVAGLRRKSKWRQTTTATTTTTASSTTPAATTSSSSSTKEHKISKMVVMISSLFIVFLFPTVLLQIVILADSSISIQGVNGNLNRVISSLTFFSESVNSSINIFIYYFNSSNYNAAFRQIFCRRSKKNSTKTI